MKKKKNKIENVLSRPQVDSVIALYSDGKYEEAIDLIKELNDQYPNEPILFNIIGACYKSLGQLEAALKMFEVAVTINPNYAEAFYNLGVVARGQDNFNLAIKSYRSAISIQPNYPDAHNNLGNTFKEQERLKEAIESYEWAIAYKHDFFQAHNNLGLAHCEINQHEYAIKSFKEAIRIYPEYSDAHFNLAIAFNELGEKEKAKSSFERVIEIDSNNCEAYRNLSGTKTFIKDDSEIKAMKLLIENKNLGVKDEISLSFALAKVYEDLGDLSKQFEFLNKGNKLRKKALNYSLEKDQARFLLLKKIFKSCPNPLKINTDSSTIRPIFIVGMPRSGTSLVEQIIATHQDVYGAGELRSLATCSLPLLNQFVEKQSKSITKKELNSIRNLYLESLLSFNTSKNIVTDKMPLNFQYIGLILSAIPEAKIIHVKRDPVATCWSNFKYFFPSKGNGFSFDQGDLAGYYSIYSDLMNFWHKLFPNKIYDLGYEELTVNQEEETKKLLNYCGLDWNKNCLEFHKNNRVVKTMSALQVRQKIYQGSSETWKKYESYLKPMIEGLGLK